MADLLKVDLCCGNGKPEGFFGVDCWPGSKVDQVADLNKTFPFKDNSVDELRAYDAIEHLPDKIHTMNEIWRVCKPDAFVDILVPSTDGRGAFQDPTHVSYWNLNSFYYYTIDSPGYLELCHRYGFKGAFKVIKLENTKADQSNVIHVCAQLQVIKLTSSF
jgi:SAM-dependent methyltransferase